MSITGSGQQPPGQTRIDTGLDLQIYRNLEYPQKEGSSVAKETQISAFVSKTTKDLLEKHVRATGHKKGYVVESALRHHLQALQELPTDVIVHPKIVVSALSGAEIARRLASSSPTPELRELMIRDGD